MSIPLRLDRHRKTEYDFLYQLTEDFGEEAGDALGIKQLLSRANITQKDTRDLLFLINPDNNKILTKEQFFCLLHLVAFNQQGKTITLQEIKNLDSDQVPDPVFEGVKIPVSVYRRAKTEERRSGKRNVQNKIENAITLLPEEIRKDTIQDVEVLSLFEDDTPPDALPGILTITNYRLVFSGKFHLENSQNQKTVPVELEIPFTCIKETNTEVYYREDTKCVHIICKDLRSIIIALQDSPSYTQLLLTIKSCSNPFFYDRFCFQTTISSDVSMRGNYNIYTPEKELQRHGSEGFWTVSDVNQSYKVSSYQPKKVLIPCGVNGTLVNAKLYAQNREQGRYPVYTWGAYDPNSPLYGSFLLRCARPKFAIEELELPKVVGYDLAYTESIFLLANHKIISRNSIEIHQDCVPEDHLIHVFDTGIKVHLLSNVYSQFCTFQFLNLTLREIQNGYTALQNAILRSFSNRRQSLQKEKIKGLTTDIWVPLIEKYLNFANTIVCKIVEGLSVMISSGGPLYETDFTLVSLVQIMIDPFYRTIEGFCILLGKDWVSYGFPFADETVTWTDAVLFHFIHCIWTLFQQNPEEFEFNQDFLAFVLDSFFSSQFGTFLHNTEQKASEVAVVQRSFFLYVLHKENKYRFENTLYSPGTSPKYPIIYGGNDIRLWTAYILRTDVSVLAHENQFFFHMESKITEAGALTIKHIMFSYFMDVHLVHLTRLTSLDISGQSFYSVPVQIAMLTNLRQLVLDGNHMLKFPEVILQQLSHLEKLSLKGNSLVSLHHNFENLTALTDLDISTNHLKMLPSIAKLTNLASLSVRQNKLKWLPGDFSSLVMLKTLSLAENAFNFINDKIIANLTNLEKLSLADNQLIVLPDVGSQKNLTKLEVQGNKLTELPDELFPRCLSLVELNLSNNKIQFLPMNIGCLTNLRTVSFSKNRITQIPEGISDCRSLKHVIGSYNLLKEVPLSLTLCGQLESIYLSHNKIPKIPYAIGRMRNLKTLDLTSNKIAYLPLILGKFKKTLELVIPENPLDQYPPEVVGKGSQAVLDYLNDALKSSSPEYHIKMFVIGDKNSGKTSLVRQFASRWTSPGYVPSEGTIKMVRLGNFYFNFKKRLPRPTISNGQVTVTIWDFPGDFFYSRFFEVSRSIFLVVFDVTRKDFDFLPWLQHIKTPLKKTKANIVLVGSHFDEEYMDNLEWVDLSLKAHKRSFPHFEFSRLHLVSCLTGEGINELQKSLEELIEAHECMEKKVPNTLSTLELLLLEYKQRLPIPVIDQKTLLYLASVCGISQVKLGKCCRQLQKFGSFLFLPKDKDVAVVDPQWLMSVIASVWKSEYLVDGFFLEPKHLNLIWKNYPTHLYPTLLDVLAKYEVAISTKFQCTGIKRATDGPSNITIVPALARLDIPPKKYTKYWTENMGEDYLLKRSYRLEFVPEAIFSRLMISCMLVFQLITMWSSGFLMKLEKTVFKDDEKHLKHALVLIESNDSLEWVISSRSDDLNVATEALMMILERAENLLEEWPNLEYSIFVITAGQSIPLKSIEEALVAGKHNILRDEKSLDLNKIAPNVSLPFYKGPRISKYTKEDVILIPGDNFNLYRGKWNGQNVTVQQYNIPKSFYRETKFKKRQIPNFHFSEFRNSLYQCSQVSFQNHPNVMQVLGVSLTPLAFLLEPVDGTLYQGLHADVAIPWSQTLRLSLDIANGIRFLNEQTPPLVHRDICSKNILVATTPTGTITAKIYGFDKIAFLDEGPLTGRVVYNSRNLAPEILMNKPYDEKVDIYSFGVLCWELITRSKFMPEFKFSVDIEPSVISGERPLIPSFCPPRFRDVIEKCWAQDPQNRQGWGYIIRQLQSLLANEKEIDEQLSVVMKEYLSRSVTEKNTARGGRRSSLSLPLNSPNRFLAPSSHPMEELFGFTESTHKLFVAYVQSEDLENELAFYMKVFKKLKSTEQLSPEQIQRRIRNIAIDFLGFRNKPALINIPGEMQTEIFKKIQSGEADSSIFDTLQQKYKNLLDEKAISFSEIQFHKDIHSPVRTKSSPLFLKYVNDNEKRGSFERHLKSINQLGIFQFYMESIKYKNLSESEELLYTARIIHAKLVGLGSDTKTQIEYTKHVTRIEAALKSRTVTPDLFDDVIEEVGTILQREFSFFSSTRGEGSSRSEQGTPKNRFTKEKTTKSVKSSSRSRFRPRNKHEVKEVQDQNKEHLKIDSQKKKLSKV